MQEFLNSVDDFHGTFEQKVNQFYEFALKNIEDTQNLLEEYALQFKNAQRCQKNIQTISSHSLFKPIQNFCKLNIQII